MPRGTRLVESPKASSRTFLVIRMPISTQLITWCMESRIRARLTTGRSSPAWMTTPAGSPAHNLGAPHDDPGRTARGQSARPWRAHDPGGQSSFADDPGGQSSLADDPGGQSSPADDPGGQSSPADDPGGQSSPADDPGAQSSFADDPGAQSSFADDPGAQASFADDPGARPASRRPRRAVRHLRCGGRHLTTNENSELPRSCEVALRGGKRCRGRSLVRR